MPVNPTVMLPSDYVLNALTAISIAVQIIETHDVDPDERRCYLDIIARRTSDLTKTFTEVLHTGEQEYAYMLVQGGVRLV